jgi:hypothetical protein
LLRITRSRADRSIYGAFLPGHQIEAMDGLHPVPLAPGLATGQFQPTGIDDDPERAAAVAPQLDARLDLGRD